MHKETFEIYTSDQCTTPDNYVLIDDLIAPVIQIINRKGYITDWCCSGHPLAKEFIIDGEWGKYQEINSHLKSSYISFKEGISLPMLPPEFAADSNFGKLIIRKWFEVNDDFYKISRSILETMEQLYKWALELPDLNG